MTTQDPKSEHTYDEGENPDPTAGLEAAAPFFGGAVGSAVSVALAAGSPGPGWVAALAGALSSPAIAAAARATIAARQRKVQRAVDAACESGRCTFEDIVAASVRSERKIELLFNMLQGAARSEGYRHAQALGRLLVDGAFAPIDEDAEYARIMSALAQLDGADVEVLGHLGRWPNTAPDDQQSFVIRDPNNSENTLARQLPHLARLLESIIGRLETLGIISSATGGATWGGLSFDTTWHLTQFGHLCVGRLLAEGTA